MSELARLLRYSRKYTAHLLLSVILMACVGAAQALTVILIGPIFDRVLNPASADAPVLLFTIPVWKHQVFLDSFMPASVHNVWTMVAAGILAVFTIKGLCDYAGNYLVNYVGLSAVTDLRQDVFDRVVHQDAHFFESNSTARVMSAFSASIFIRCGRTSVPPLASTAVSWASLIGVSEISPCPIARFSTRPRLQRPAP